jgi:hypothetical protein
MPPPPREWIPVEGDPSNDDDSGSKEKKERKSV